ncbi:MAG: hypothetical protein ABIR15_21675 [Chitinophagaceae bacterium]
MKKQIPFDFLLDYLPADVVIRPAISIDYIYWDKKIVLIFRNVIKNAQHNDLWIATKKEYHDSLKAEIPAITNFVFDERETFDSAWLQINDDHDDFETAAIRICQLIPARGQKDWKRNPESR